MDGMNVGGGAGFDAYLNLQPPGQERGGFANIKGSGAAPAEGGNQGTATLAGHFGYSDKDTMGTHLDEVFQFAEQLNISLILGSGSSDSVIQLYLNNMNPTAPTLPPIKFLLEISHNQLEKGDIGGAQLPKEGESRVSHKEGKDHSVKGSGDESDNSGNASNQSQGWNIQTNNDPLFFESGAAPNQGTQGQTNNSMGNTSNTSGGKTVDATGSTQQTGPTYVNEAKQIDPQTGLPLAGANRITNQDVKDRGDANYKAQMSDISSEAANKKEPFSFISGDKAPGTVSDTPTASEIGVPVNPSGTLSTNNTAARSSAVGAAGTVDSKDVQSQAHAGATTVTSDNTTKETTDNKNDIHFFTTKESKAGSGDSGGAGGQSGGGNQSGGDSSSSFGFGSLSDVAESHAKTMDGLNASLDNDVSALEVGNTEISTITIIRPSGGNPWLAGNSFLEFQLAFSQLQRVLMMNNVVQGRVELAGMKMNVDLAKQTADTIMAIAQINMMVHIASAVMAAASLAVSFGGIGGGAAAARRTAANAKSGNPNQGKFGPFTEGQWTSIGQTGVAMDKMTTSIVQAMTATTIAQKEGMKEILQAYRSIAQHIMDKATEATKNNEDLISQLLQTKDKMVDSTQQAVAAALRK